MRGKKERVRGVEARVTDPPKLVPNKSSPASFTLANKMRPILVQKQRKALLLKLQLAMQGSQHLCTWPTTTILNCQFVCSFCSQSPPELTVCQAQVSTTFSLVELWFEGPGVRPLHTVLYKQVRLD